MNAVSELMETVKAAGPIGGASMVTGAIVLLGILKKVRVYFLFGRGGVFAFSQTKKISLHYRMGRRGLCLPL